MARAAFSRKVRIRTLVALGTERQLRTWRIAVWIVFGILLWPISMLFILFMLWGSLNILLLTSQIRLLRDLDDKKRLSS